jgi:hypothetical protein
MHMLVNSASLTRWHAGEVGPLPTVSFGHCLKKCLWIILFHISDLQTKSLQNDLEDVHAQMRYLKQDNASM